MPAHASTSPLSAASLASYTTAMSSPPPTYGTPFLTASALQSLPSAPGLTKQAVTDLDTTGVDVLCVNCYEIIRVEEVDQHSLECCSQPGLHRTGSETNGYNSLNGVRSSGYDASSSTPSPFASPSKNDPEKSLSVINEKLKKLLKALESRMEESERKGGVANQQLALSRLKEMKNMSSLLLSLSPSNPASAFQCLQTVNQIRSVGTEVSGLSGVGPGLFIFCKRIENVAREKAKEIEEIETLRLAARPESSAHDEETQRKRAEVEMWKIQTELLEEELKRQQEAEVESDDDASVLSDVRSDMGSEMAGSVYAESFISDMDDVADLQSATEVWAEKTEEELRKYFYSQCLTAKLSLPQSHPARKIMISALYQSAKDAEVHPEAYVGFIRDQFSKAL
eukprot:GILI01015793.1.p1 GENE.GILI01015793.1~~GILI01015793.1.p1  ORF type:complete len:428 (-),score=84.53 GILI01015793.1:444-1631(-)